MTSSKYMLFFIKIMGKIPLSISHKLGETIGWFLYQFDNGMRFKVTRNVTRCFPTLPAPEQKTLIKRSMQETMKMVLEMPIVWSTPKTKKCHDLLTLHNEALLKNAYHAGKGVLLLSPHLGAWEVAIFWLAKHYPVYAMYKPQKKPEINDFVARARGDSGTVMVPATVSGIRTAIKALRAGKVVAILPDHDPGENNGGCFVPFFGIQTRTMSLVNELAKRTNAAVVFGFAKRLSAGKGYEGYFQAAHPDIYSEDRIKALTSMNQDIEKMVALAPEQYEWAVRRFRARPQGEAPFYDKH